MPTLHQHPAILSQELDGELLLLRDGSRDVLHLDAVASDVWRLLGAGPTRDELVHALSQAYAVAPGRVAADLDGALEVLVEHGLVSEQP